MSAMKPDSMRFIDKTVGIPLTFLFSVLLFPLQLFFRKRQKPDLSHTLFIELSEMGSALLVDPAMRKLKAQGGGQLYFVIFKSNRKSLDILGTVPYGQVFEMRSHNLWVLALDVLRFMAWCRSKHITTAIDLELFSRFTALLTVLSGASSRVGFVSLHDEGLYRGNLISHPVRYNSHVHIAINFLSLVNNALGLQHEKAYPTHPVSTSELILEKALVSPESQQKVWEKIRQLYPDYQGEKIFLVNANASDLLPQRKWLPERFAELTQHFLKDHPRWIAIATGAPAERAYVQDVVDRVAHPLCVNSAGVFAFEELVPLYSISSLMLTNDSGPAHFASVTNLKTFVIFGPETPYLYLPLGGNAEAIYLGLPCSPCVSAANHRKTTCQSRPCISGIPTEMVRNRINAFVNTQFLENVAQAS
jgi:ADP-heptose:LPS heptosyltransferase